MTTPAILPTRPIALPANPVERFYAGGPRIGALRGIEGWGGTAPEDWVGSATAVAGERERGLARLTDGRLLPDAITADAEAFLGPDHVDRFGDDPALLVKLLDAGQRLPVHWHPNRDFARTRIGSPYGKTEAWVIVEAEGEPVVHLGWRRDVADADLHAWFGSQDVEAMLAAMHEVPVAAGDTVFVPAGIPHAIGAGILLVELQEPTDLSVLLEWKGFTDDPAGVGDLGLGYGVALGSARLEALTDDDLTRLRARRAPAGRAGIVPLFPGEADRFFRAELVSGVAELEPGFSILVVVSGEGSIRTEGGEEPVRRGNTVLVPFAAGGATVAGDLHAVRCRPPLEPPEGLAGSGSTDHAMTDDEGDDG